MSQSHPVIHIYDIGKVKTSKNAMKKQLLLRIILKHSVDQMKASLFYTLCGCFGQRKRWLRKLPLEKNKYLAKETNLFCQQRDRSSVQSHWCCRESSFPLPWCSKPKAHYFSLLAPKELSEDLWPMITIPSHPHMTHSQMLGKVKYGLPAKIWRLIGCTEMLSW